LAHKIMKRKERKEKRKKRKKRKKKRKKEKGKEKGEKYHIQILDHMMDDIKLQIDHFD